MLDKYINALKGFVPSLISITAAFVIARLIYELAGPALGINDSPDVVGGVILAVGTAVAASLLTVLVVTAIDSGK